MTKMLENEMLFDKAKEPEEQDGDSAYDLERADNDFADLRAELVSITRLSAITGRIEKLTKELLDLSLPRRRG